MWPWHSQSEKLVIARETPTGWTDWTVLDQDSNLDVENFSIAADDVGTIHIVYIQSRLGLDERTEFAYARLEPTPPA